MRIVDYNGVDLSDLPPGDIQSVNGASVAVQCRIIEDDPALPFARISGTVNWADGSLPNVYTGTGTVTINAHRALSTGNYVVTVGAQNYETPPEFAQVNFGIIVKSDTPVQTFDRIMFGPILPRDNGNPNTANWNFDLSQDLYIIESSLKNLLITTKGERVMQPTYGTRLRYLLFEPNTSGIQAMVQAEIVEALNQWEPRIVLASVRVVPEGRDVKVEVVVMSKQTQNQFQTTVTFVR